MMFAHVQTRTVEWGDCDPAGIVFYPRFFAMFDAATSILIEAATRRSRAELVRHYAMLGWPMVDTRAEFHAPVRYDDRVRIESRVTRLGRSSFDIAHRLLHADRLCVSASEVRVWSAYGPDGAPVATPLPPEILQALGAGEKE